MGVERVKGCWVDTCLTKDTAVLRQAGGTVARRMRLPALSFGTCILGFSRLSNSLGPATNPPLSHTLVPSLKIRVDGDLLLTSQLAGCEIMKYSGLL